jgi:beta-glucosidase
VRLEVNGVRVIDDWTSVPRASVRSAPVRLEAGKPVDVRLEYFEAQRDAEVRLTWTRPGAKAPEAEAVDAANAADVVLFFGGLSGEVEGEEMPVSFPGFAGGDRTDIALPATQDRLLRRLQATGKPIVLVLMTGSAIASEWAVEHLPAVVVAWYPGQRGGTALADVLFGDVNPSGRLPVTFYRSVAQLPAFDDYSMQGRTYRYFDGAPLYPFGHGLSYTTFAYSGLQAVREPGRPIAVSVDVANTGSRAGAEVVQLYVRAVNPAVPMPRRSLRGFARVSLEPRAATRVSFELTPERDMARYDEDRRAMVIEPGEYEIEVGASSGDIRQRARVTIAPMTGRARP